MKKIFLLTVLFIILLLVGCQQMPAESQTLSTEEINTGTPSEEVEQTVLHIEHVNFPERKVNEAKNTGYIPALNNGSNAVGVVLQIEDEDSNGYTVRASNGKTYTVDKDKVKILDAENDIRQVDVNNFKARPYDKLFPAKNTIVFDDGSYIIQLRDILVNETVEGEKYDDFVQVKAQEEFATFYFTKDGEYISYLPAFQYTWINYAKKFDFNRDGVEDIFGITLPIEEKTETGLTVSVGDYLNKKGCSTPYEDVKLYANISVDGSFSFVSDAEGFEPDSITNPLCNYSLFVEEMYCRNQKSLHLLDMEIKLDTLDYPQWSREPYCDKCKRLYEAE